MVSISHVVEEIVKHKPYLSESLSAGIINVSALARRILPEVEAAMGKKVNTGAVVMSLNRLTPYLQTKEQMSLSKLLNSMGDIILRSNLCDYTFKNSSTLINCHIEMLKHMVNNRRQYIYFIFNHRNTPYFCTGASSVYRWRVKNADTTNCGVLISPLLRGFTSFE